METPREVLLEIIGNQVERRLAYAAGINPSTITNVKLGQKPSLETTLKIAALIKDDPELRARWFAACGYADPTQDTTTPALDQIRQLAARLDTDPTLTDVDIEPLLSDELTPNDRAIINQIYRAFVSTTRHQSTGPTRPGQGTRQQ